MFKLACVAAAATAVCADAPARCNPESEPELLDEAPDNGVPLTLLPQDKGDESPACLDGSPYGFYFQPSTTGSTKWTVSINGGGWCYDEVDCFCRSKTGLGTSKADGKTGGCSCINPKEDGTMETDCNCIHMPYSGEWCPCCRCHSPRMPGTHRACRAHIALCETNAERVQ